MKAKLKSGNAVVRFLLGHGEKLGMLGIVACVGLLVWSSLGRERLDDDRTPANLTRLANNAQQKVDDATWGKLSEEVRLKADTKMAGEMTKVSGRHFPPPPYPLDRPVLDPVGLRTDPVLFACEELEVRGDSGLWASADPEVIKQKQIEWKIEQERLANEEKQRRDRAESDAGRGRRGRRGGGERLFGEGGYSDRRGARGQRETRKGGTIVERTRSGAQLQGYEEIAARSWVTVLAKIPIEGQHRQYEDALQSARGYNESRDMPIYLGYIVERAEVTDAGQSEWKQIDLIKQSVLEKRLQTYPANVADPIDPKVKHPLITHPLPPLILREWGKLVTHSSMPLASEIDPSKTKETEEPEIAEETEEGEDVFGSSRSRERNARRAGVEGLGGRGTPFRGAYGGRGVGGGGFGEYGGGEYGGYGGEGGEYGGYGGEYGGYGGGGGRLGLGSAAKIGSNFTWDRETSHLLFRYFDYRVQPGHRYRYRVRLAMSDVNDDVRERYLDKTVTERRSKLEKKYRRSRLSDWSEPSPVASVPLPARVYLVGAKEAKESNYMSEPEAELLIKALNSEFAAEVAFAEDFGRGSVVNVHEKATVVWSNDYEVEKDPEFQFRTGITVVDFAGGGKLPGKNLTAPARALLMDPAGRLFLLDELEDEQTVADYQAILDGGSAGHRGYGGPEYGGGEYGGGEYGGGEYGGEGYGGEGY